MGRAVLMGKAVAITLLLLGQPASAWFDNGPDPRLMKNYLVEILGGMEAQAHYEAQMRVTCEVNRDAPRTPDWNPPCP